MPSGVQGAEGEGEMTDRHAGYLVVIAKDIREDDAKLTMNALRMVKGVIDVKPVVAGFEQQIGYQRARDEISAAVWAAFQVIKDKT